MADIYASASGQAGFSGFARSPSFLFYPWLCEHGMGVAYAYRVHLGSRFWHTVITVAPNTIYENQPAYYVGYDLSDGQWVNATRTLWWDSTAKQWMLTATHGGTHRTECTNAIIAQLNESDPSSYEDFREQLGPKEIKAAGIMQFTGDASAEMTAWRPIALEKEDNIFRDVECTKLKIGNTELTEQQLIDLLELL